MRFQIAGNRCRVDAVAAAKLVQDLARQRRVLRIAEVCRVQELRPSRRALRVDQHGAEHFALGCNVGG